MATVRVEIGATCAGGGHVEVRKVVDGQVAWAQPRPVDTLVGRPAVAARDTDSAVEKLLSETQAETLAEFKALVEAKSVVVADPRPGEQPQAGDSLAGR